MLLGEFVPSPLTAADATTATTNNLATHPEGEAGQREEGQQIHQDSGGGEMNGTPQQMQERQLFNSARDRDAQRRSLKEETRHRSLHLRASIFPPSFSPVIARAINAAFTMPPPK